jgi:hypothetical protein
MNNNNNNNNNIPAGAPVAPAAAAAAAVAPMFAPIVAMRAADGSAACYMADAAQCKIITAVPAAGDVAAPCIGCNLANGGANAQGSVLMHAPGACLIPASAYGPCLRCQATTCAADCMDKATVSFERVQLLQIATVAWGTKSGLALRSLEDSTEVWRLNGTSADLNKSNSKVDGINVIGINKRRIPGYGGGFNMAGGRWTPAGQGAETAISFLRKHAVIDLHGYTGQLPRPAFPPRPQNALPANGDNAADSVAEMERLKARVRELEEASATLQTKLITAEDTAKQFQERDGSSGVGAAPVSSRPQIGLGSEAGTLSSRQAFEIGKATMCFSQVFAENSVAAKLTHVPILPNVCARSGGRSVKEIKLPWWVLQHEPTEVPNNLRAYLEDKFAFFNKLLDTYASSNLLPMGFYNAGEWHHLFRRLYAYANDSYEAAIARGDAATIRRTSLLVIIREADELAIALLSKALLRHEVVDLNVSNEPCLQRAFSRVEPVRMEGKRGPDLDAREQANTPGADAQKRPKPDVSLQTCDNYNNNKGACRDGAAQCKNGRRHVCSKCGKEHARFSSPACR